MMIALVILSIYGEQERCQPGGSEHHGGGPPPRIAFRKRILFIPGWVFVPD